VDQDEEGAVAALKEYLDAVLPIIADYGGRVIDTAGDGILAEFPSAARATEAAIAIQPQMAGQDADAPPDRRFQFRIRVNIGDVIVDGGKLFGDGVNVASRLQGLAKPGGVCISDIVHQAVADRIQVSFRDLGNQRVKNISRPIRIWQWTPDATTQTTRPAEAELHQRVQFATASDSVQIA
jgi:class 3 adenylate cyclase